MQKNDLNFLLLLSLPQMCYCVMLFIDDNIVLCVTLIVLCYNDFLCVTIIVYLCNIVLKNTITLNLCYNINVMKNINLFS